MTPELSILIKATVALAIGLIAVRLGSRARASVRHLVLAATLAVLCALPLVSAAVPAMTLAVPVPAALARPAIDPAIAVPQPSIDGRVVVSGVVVAPAAAAADRGVPAGIRPSLATVLRVSWALGAAILLGVLAHALWRFGRIRRSGVPWLAGQAIVDRLAGPDAARRISVIVHEAVPAPVTGGWRHPLIVFPADAHEWSSDDIERALVHELEHIRRGDWGVQLLARVVCVAYWFHPLVWMTWRRLCLECERACDDAVVDRTADTEYARQLVTLAGRLSQSDLQPVLSMARRSDLSVRVKAVLDRSQLRGRAGTSAVAVALVVTAVIALIIAPMRVQAVPAAPVAEEVRVPATAVPAVLAMPGEAVAVAAARVEQPAAAPEGEAAGGQGPNQRANQRSNRGQGDSNNRSTRGDALGRALVEAAQGGSLEDVAELLDAGADVNTVARGDGTALLVAARRGDRAMVDFLLQRGATDLASPGDGTALIQAARYDHVDIVRTLLDAGADVNLAVRGDGSPLIMAAQGGRLNLVRVLLDAGADVNLAIEGDGNPLIVASRGGHLNVVRLLLERGANIHNVVPGDENAIISACEGGQLEVVRFLVSRGADVNSRVWVEHGWPDRQGEWRTPLSQARKGGYTDVVRYLLSVGARE